MPKDRNEFRCHLGLHPRPFDKLRVQPVQVVEWCFDKFNKLSPEPVSPKKKAPVSIPGPFLVLG